MNMNQYSIPGQAIAKSAASITIAVLLSATIASANPNGGQVVQGSASFSQPNANTLNVTNSHNTIINWQQFNIGAGQTTNFIQPNSASAVLNRVISNNPSQIFGSLNSNGQVFLINQHGILVGAGAQINTSGFFGSTLNITDQDFLNGNLKFEGGGLGDIDNQGYIHAGEDGNIVLIAPNIENGGVIEVDNGNIMLTAGESITITSLENSAIEFDVQSPDNKITNLGSIIANNGAASLFAGSLTHSGSIKATGLIQNADGTISLVAQETIEVTDTGSLNTDGENGGDIVVQSQQGDVYFSGEASAQGEKGQGGNIQIFGDRVGLFNQANVNASGQTGGGEILVGGDYQGQGDTQTAQQTQVSRDAVIKADAIESGDGGKVIFWADDYTEFYGSVSATGGSVSGNGGFIEVSGKENLGFGGFADASAINGLAGEVLFDPDNIIIVTAAVGAITTLPLNPYEFTSDLGLNVTFLASAITDITNQGTNVTIKAVSDITVNGDIITNAGGNGGDMIFQAGLSMNINANIVTDNGLLSITVHDVNSGSTATSAVASLTMAASTVLDAGTGNIEITMGPGVGFGTSSGDISLSSLNANHIIVQHQGSSGGNIIGTDSSNLISASSVFINHDTFSGGSIGGIFQNPSVPLNINADFIAAHVHNSSSANFININASPRDTNVVTVGGTCYGTGTAAGCNTFGAHLIKGIEMVGDGDIDLDVTGNLAINEDVLIGGSIGNLNVNATGSINVNDAELSNFASGASTSIITSGTKDLTLNLGSSLGIDGTVNANVNSLGGVIEVDQFFSLAINGTLTLDDASILVYDIAFPDGIVVGDISVTGNVALGGQLIALWVNDVGFDGDFADLLTTGGSFSGAFSGYRAPVGVTASTLNNSILANTMSLTLVTVASNDIIFWDSTRPPAGDWNTALNWVGGAVPTATQFAVIPYEPVSGGPITVTISSPVTVLGLESQSQIDISNAGALTVNGDSLIGDNLNLLSSGGITSNGEMLLFGSVDWSNGNLAGTGNIITHQISDFIIQGTAGNIDTTLINNSLLGMNWDAGMAAGTGGLTNNSQLTMSNTAGTSAAVINSGTLSVTGNSVFTNLTNTGSIDGSGNLTVSNAFNWTGGSITLGSLTTNGVTTINSASSVLLSAGSWINAGTVNWTGGNLQVGGTAIYNGGFFNANATANMVELSSSSFSNSVGGTFSVNSDTTLSVDYFNDGIFENIAGTTTASGNWSNFGTVGVKGGALVIQGGNILGNDMGSYIVDANAALKFSSDRTIEGSLLSSGLVVIDNAAIDLNGGLFTITSGATLAGNGTLKGSVKNDGGTLEIGGDAITAVAKNEDRLLNDRVQPTLGAFVIEGNFEQVAGSLMIIDLLGDGTILTYDTLTVTGNTILGGDLLLNFLPTSSTTLPSNFGPLILQGTVTNQFNKVSLSDGRLVNFNGGLFTLAATSLNIPQEITESIISSVKESVEFIKTVTDIKTEQEVLITEFGLELEEDDEEGEKASLICT